MKSRGIVLAILLKVFALAGFSQVVVDDSTKLVYGAHSTRYVLEEDILNSRDTLHYIDTTIDNFHQYDYLYRGLNIYQNLGNLGTPLNPVYFEANQNIGINFGFNSFNPYAYDPSRIRYYETRSPFSELRYVQGTNGQQMANGAFSRNIKPNWNAGFEIRKIASNKLIGALGLKDPQVNHTSFLFHTRYFTKDSTYQILANLTVLDHKNYETGGVLDTTVNSDLIFTNRAQDVYFYNATTGDSRSLEKRTNFHIFHQLVPSQRLPFQVFHIFNAYKQSNRFSAPFRYVYDFATTYGPPLHYPFDTVQTGDRTDFHLLENKAGIKGSKFGISYRIYYRRKDFSYIQYYVPYNRKFSENFGGAVLSYNLPFKSVLTVSGEYLFSRNTAINMRPTAASQTGNDYRVRAELTSPILTAGAYSVLYAPTLLQTRYLGNDLFWDTEGLFKSPSVQEFYANGNFRFGNLTLRPGGKYSLINNYIYFNALSLPDQYSGTINYMSADLYLKFFLGNFYLENNIRYANASAIIQVPQLFEHARIYYQNQIFRKAMLAQIGVDLYWKSSYKANLYMPLIQTYYLNTFFNVPSYLLADLFVNVQLGSFAAFLKLSNLNQGFTSPGYFSTPYYPGMKRNFEFGIRWLFYD